MQHPHHLPDPDDAREVRERRAQASHPPRVRPELVATGPDQVWTQISGRGVFDLR